MNRVRELWERYVFNVGFHGARTIHDVYGRPSSTKVSIWNDIVKSCEADSGFKCSVITYNCHFFTAGYMFKKDDKLFFKGITKSCSGIIEIGPNEKWDAVEHGVL